MKKLLALVLALVMAMSLVTISNADFKDADEISYKEAVDVMNAVGVLAGYDNGNFGPKDTLTRAQACKIIAYLDLGEEIAEALPALQVFSDVPADNWAAKYIAYCADAGYVSGVGDGKFDPDAKVTGYQFGKMLLCVLGYDAEYEQFTGSSWEINVAKKMKQLDLADKIAKAASAALTREEAAQYGLNALKTQTVTANKGTTTKVEGVTVVTGGKAATPNTNYIDYKTNNGDLEDADAAYLCEQLYGLDLLYKATGVTDDFGRKAHTWYWEGYTSKYEIGTYADKAAYTFVVSSTKDTANVLAVIDELGANVADSFDKTAAKGVSVAVGDTIEFYTTDGKITYYNIFKTQLAKVTKVAAASKDAEYDYNVTLKIAGSTTKTYKDTELVGFKADSMAKDTYVTYTTVTAVGKDGVMVAVADKVSGKNTGTNDSTYVKVDGTKLTYNGTGVWAVDDFVDDFTNTYDFYVDANGYVIGAVKTSDINTIDNIFYVAEANFVAGSTFADKKAQLNVYYLDGTNAIVNMVIDSNKKVNIGGTETALPDTAGTLSVPGNFYAYTTDGDEIAKITKIADGVVKNTNQNVTADASVVLTEKSPVVKIGGTDYYASSSTKIVLIDKDGKVTTHTGYSKLPTQTYTFKAWDSISDNQAAGALYVADKTDLKELYIVAVYERAGAVDDTVYGYFVKNDGNVYNAEEKYSETTLIFNVDGKDTEYLIKTSVLEASYAGLFTLEVKDGYVDADPVVTNVNKDIDSTGDGYVVIDGAVKRLADDCAIYDATDAEAITAITADELNDGDVICYTLDSDSKINRIFVAYAAQDDGVIEVENTAAFKAYLQGELGYTAANADIVAAFGDGIVVKYTISEDVSGILSAVITDTDTGTAVTTYDNLGSVSFEKDDVRTITFDLAADCGGDGNGAYPVGDYEIVIKVDTTTVATYSFSVGA